MPAPAVPSTRRPRWSVGAVVGAYSVVGLLWIVLSTPAVGDLAGTLDVSAETVELAKGILFVLVTGAVLYPSMRQWETAYVETARRSHQDLQLRERRFRHLAENTQGAVYRIRFSPRPQLEYVSPQFEEMTGYGEAELRADPDLLATRVHPEDRELLAFLGTEDPTHGPTEPAVVTFRFQRADGGWVWLEDHHTPEVGPDGRVEADQGIVFDVTARRRHEEARTAALEHERAASEHLRRTVQAHQAFLTGISHELRTPLTGVMGFAQTLEEHDGVMEVAQRRALLTRLTANANRLGRLLDDLLDLDRLNRGVLELHEEDGVDLAGIIRVIADELDAPQHRMVLDVPRTALRLDRTKVERIIDNLLRNAIKHTPPGTTVWVRAEDRAEDVLVVVEDDGPGLDEESEQLFQPFRQGSAASTSASPGTGIGLALVREFSTIHGGEAWYEPRDPHGARFCVRLPASRDD